jgi:AcrR family transcriptional regulator
MEEIAVEAGLAKGTLYLYFSSKRDVYLAAVFQGLRQLNQELRAKVEAAKGLREKLRVYIGTGVAHFERDHEFLLIYLSEIGNALSHPAERADEFREIFLEHARQLESVLRASMEQGEIRELRPDSTAFAICDMARGTIVQRMLGWSTATLEEDIEGLLNLIWRGIAA